MRDWLPLCPRYAAEVGVRLRHIRMSDVVRAVSEESGVSVGELLGPRRMHVVSHARQLAMLVMKERCPWNSYPQMGEALGGKDHTTIIHGVRAATERIKRDAKYRALYEVVTRRLDGALEAAE